MDDRAVESRNQDKRGRVEAKTKIGSGLELCGGRGASQHVLTSVVPWAHLVSQLASILWHQEGRDSDGKSDSLFRMNQF